MQAPYKYKKRTVVIRRLHRLERVDADEAGDVPGGFGSEWSRVATGLIETRMGPALLLDLPALVAGPEQLGAVA